MYAICDDNDIRSRITALCKIGATYYLKGDVSNLFIYLYIYLDLI